MSPLFPLFLKLEGERAVVVGGGAVAAHKAELLLAHGAQVTVIAAAVGAEIAALGAAHERLLVVARAFAPDDVAGARVVVAATDDAEVNAAVARAARAAHALVNVVDVPDLCDFYTGGVVQRGPLTVVVGTSGASPSLARRVRLVLDEALSAGLAPLARALGHARPRLLARFPDFKDRAARLDRFVEDAVARVDATTTDDEVARWIARDLLDEKEHP